MTDDTNDPKNPSEREALSNAPACLESDCVRGAVDCAADQQKKSWVSRPMSGGLPSSHDSPALARVELAKLDSNDDVLLLEAGNTLFCRMLDGRESANTVTFDLAFPIGHDSPCIVEGTETDEACAGTVDDLKSILYGIPLDQVVVSMDAQRPVIPLLACFIVAAQERGFDPSELSVTLLSEVQKTPYFTPKASMRIIRDIILYARERMPRFKGVSISAHHEITFGSDDVQELALLLAEGREYVSSAASKRLDADTLSSYLSFTFSKGMSPSTDAARLRAARLVWRRIMVESGSMQPDTLVHRAQPAPTFLPKAYSETNAPCVGSRSDGPSISNATLGANIDLPPAGSRSVEKMSEGLANDVWNQIVTLGQNDTISKPILRLQTWTAAGRTQPPVGQQNETSLGAANKPDHSASTTKNPTLRDQAECDAALSMVEASANIDKGNLLELAMDAVRARATLEEVTMVMERSFGRCPMRTKRRSGPRARFQTTESRSNDRTN